MGDLASGQRYGVFIDDTGSPGMQSSETGPHPGRTSWVGVVIPPSQMPEVLEQLSAAVKELKMLIGASEFHCKDIFQGTGQFKGLDLQLRLNILSFLADTFNLYRFPIFVQTFDPVSLANIQQREPGLRDLKVGAFGFSKPNDTALFFLLFHIHRYLAEHRQSKDHLAAVFVDEGFVNANRALENPIWREAFVDGLICFVSSATVLPLQLADFAAYALNRQQILLGREKLSRLEQTLMEVLTKASFNFQNIPTVSVRIDQEGGWNFGAPQ